MPATPAHESPYIVTAWYDWLFFLAPPLLALLLGISISGTPFADRWFTLWGGQVTWSSLLIVVFIHAHLVLVLVRSHGNREIFKLHKLRFTLVPGLLFLAIVSSNLVMVAASVLATFWDVYHSGMQTFGFGRIYDAKAGNDPTAGRKLDWALNQLLYAGPIVAGATMIDHFEDLEEFESAGVLLFSSVPAWMDGHQAALAWTLIGGGTVFVAYYVVAQIRLGRAGRRVAWPKVFLYASTGLTSIYTWGFNSWGEAFFIMNLFHALQYFGIVWASEHRNLERTLRLEGTRIGKPVTLGLFVALPLLYGCGVAYLDPEVRWLWTISLVISLMHFWYDGFIWSVRAKQV